VNHEISIVVNGEHRTTLVDSRRLLVHHLREDLELTGTHVGCDSSTCGACTVLVDDRPTKSCTVLAASVDGSRVLTVEGLADPGGHSPVQRGFRARHGLQCGFCTSGMLVAATALLADQPDPDDRAIREGLEGNICRCTGYQTIVESVRWAAEHGGAGNAATAHIAAAREPS